MNAKKSSPKNDLEKQISDLTDALQRERADADNVRKQATQQQADSVQRGQEIAIQKLLPLLDGLSAAFTHAPQELANNKWVQGVLSLDKQLAKLCADFGLEKIETIGHKFDPETMQAVSVEGGEGEPDQVTEELQSGYSLNGRLLRPAMVRVQS